MLSSKALITLLFCPLPFISVALWGAVYHLYALGKSKTFISKDSKSIPFFKKVLLYGYVVNCKYHVSTAKKLCLVWWAYIFVVLLCIATWLYSGKTTQFFTICIYIKVFVFDLPISIYSFVKTKHHKNGGVTWVWTKND